MNREDQRRPLYQYDGRLRALAKQLDGLQGDFEAKKMALTDYLHEANEQELVRLCTSPSQSGEDQQEAASQAPYDGYALAQRHGLKRVFDDWHMRKAAKCASKPFERLACGNFRSLPEDVLDCKNEGKMACGQCKLVSYCSKECQKAHWKAHKETCKTSFQSPDWQPVWMDDNRRPDFGKDGPRIWKNIPAIDVLNWSENERTATPPRLAIAYVGSSDLPNVIRTVNELPSRFTGELVILLNGYKQPVSFIRSVLALLILTIITDIPLAAETALHFLTSAFYQIPHDHVRQFVARDLIMAVKSGNTFSLNLGKNSTIRGIISETSLNRLLEHAKRRASFEDATLEYKKARFLTTQRDRCERHFCHLKPPHREAFWKSRGSGFTYPAGGPVRANAPNAYLFSPDEKWLQDDMAYPTDEWNIEDVVAAGLAHGCPTGDIFGCFYFYLSNQLRTFAKRLRNLNISFRIVEQDPRLLAKHLGLGVYSASLGLPKNVIFDRIDMSNLADNEEVGGIAGIVKEWAPFLNRKNPNSTIFGHTANWVAKQPKSQPGSTEMQELTLQLLGKGRLDSKKMQPGLIPAWFKYYVALYDNSAAFEEYLKKQGVDEAAKQAGLKRKKRHTIVPHRIGGRLGDPPDALPHFPTDDSWYWNVQVSQTSLSEQFFEFGIA